MTEPYRPDVVTGKYDPKMFDPTGETLLVNEIFYSIQGEGYWTGHAAIFIRLAKCNLACKFCDTEFETYEQMTLKQIAHGIDIQMERYKDRVLGSKFPFVVLTGGEPGLQNCLELIELLHDDAGIDIHVETSGSVFPFWLSKCQWVTCSPKVRLSHIQGKMKVDEWKWIVNDAFLRQYERHPEDFMLFGSPYNYLQPESNKPEFIKAACEIIKKDPRYRLSLQTHKIAGNR